MIKITPEKIKQYRNDIILFLEEQFILENGKPIVIEDWQKEKIFNPVFYNKVKGIRKHNLALYGLPKKNGKSTMSAGIASYMLLFDVPGAEVYGIAGDKDQAKIIFSKTKKAIERNPFLLDAVKIYKDEIVFPATDSIYKVLSADAPTAHGLNPSCIIADELWNQPNSDLWDALTYSPVRKEPLYVIISYAGYSHDSLLYELYDQGLSGKDPKFYFFWSEVNLASWITPEYLEQQRRRLHPSTYLRLHCNSWTHGENSFVTEEEVKRSQDNTLVKKFNGDPGINYVYACDLGLVKDRTASVIIHKEKETVIVDAVEVWQGTKDNPVAIKDVEKHMEKSVEEFNLSALLVDPWQLKSVFQEHETDWRMLEFNFSGKNLNDLTKNLYFIISNSLLRFYPHKELYNELLSVIIKDMSYGSRIDHKAGGKSDIVIALGIACWQLAQTKDVKLKEEEFASSEVERDFTPGSDVGTLSEFDGTGNFQRIKPGFRERIDWEL